MIITLQSTSGFLQHNSAVQRVWKVTAADGTEVYALVSGLVIANPKSRDDMRVQLADASGHIDLPQEFIYQPNELVI